MVPLNIRGIGVKQFLQQLLAASVVFCSFSTAFAGDASQLKVDRLRAYLIYEDTGDLSKNLAKSEDTIIANDEKGTSVQMLVDVVVTGPADQIFESNPTLIVVATSSLAQPGDRAMVDTGFPISFISSKGQLSRTIVVDHGCNGFDLEAYIMDGDKRVSEIKKSFPLTCGD